MQKIASELTRLLADTGDKIYFSDGYLVINKLNIVRVLFFLKKAKGYLQLVDLFAVNATLKNSKNQKFNGFHLYYHILNYITNTRIIIKTFLEEDEIISSVHQVFANANFYEREAYEKFGVKFLNHPNLENIFT